MRDNALENESLPRGSYFLAGILRLNFIYEKYDQLFRSSVIVKVPQLGAYQLHGEYLLCYKKEKFIYETVFPIMYQSFPPNDRLVPDFFGATDRGTLILENLRESGFYQKPNGSLLNTSTCKVVLRALAQFHALSVRQLDNLSVSLNSLTVVDKGKCEWVTKVYPVIVRKLRTYVLPFCSGDVRIKFEEYMCNLSSVLKLGQMPNENGFNVMIHGDFHHYNVLLKDSEQKKPTQCKLIDFQYCRIGSPILDIMLFLVTSVDCKIVEKHWRALFNCYLCEFESIRKKTQSDWPCPYGINDMMNDFEKYKSVFIYGLVSFVPFYWIGSSKLDLNLGDKNWDAIDSVMKSEAYISFFKGWINHLLSGSKNTMRTLS